MHDVEPTSADILHTVAIAEITLLFDQSLVSNTVYLVRVKGRQVYCIDRAAKPKVLIIDLTEHRFKLGLVNAIATRCSTSIKTSSLVGQSIISYLQKKGYPEIALQFVQDPQTRFELAIECSNLDVAT
ncbi:hypothetical protein LTR49_022152 [Elasticomyces elasticus]|nr:hypothetical protein LTR49_022152 [Elasticomyces elasticus]